MGGEVQLDTQPIRPDTLRYAPRRPAARSAASGVHSREVQSPAQLGRLGRFRLVEKVGQGGAGVVYQAVDEKLGRRVALKVLRPDRVGEGEHRQRLLREARAAAAISHANIAAVYDVDEADGQVYLAMEWVEGRTLREVIGGRPVATHDALRFAIGVAGGLVKAHAAGVIHRDLKPDNVRVTPEGEVKILDFGLAKALHSERSDGDTLTESGVVLGTPPYMSPEQARGRAIDTRSDLFSFGAILYEMLTGRRAFDGEGPVDVIDAILNRPIAVQGEMPPALARIVRKCLEKDRALRYASAAELLDDLRDVTRRESLAETREARAPDAARVRRLRRPLVVGLAAAAAAAGAVIVVWTTLGSRGRRPTATPAPTAPAPAQPPQLWRLTRTPADNPMAVAAVSPGGRYLIHDDVERQLHLRVISTGETVPLRAPPGRVRYVSWYPEETRVLAVVEEGPPAELRPAVWSLSILGAEPQQLPIPGALSYPVVSPDGARLAAGSPDGLVLYDVGTWTRRVVIAADGKKGVWFHNLAWSADGRRLAYVRHDWVEPRRRLSVASVDVTSGVEVIHLGEGPRTGAMGGGSLAWLADGRLVFLMEGEKGLSLVLATLAVDTQTGRTLGEPALLVPLGDSTTEEVRASPDGRSLVFIRQDAQWTLVTADLDAPSFQPHRLPGTEDIDRLIGWLGDAALLVQSRRQRQWGLYRRSADGRTEELLRAWPDGTRIHLAPDAKSVYTTQQDASGVVTLRRATLDASENVTLAETPGVSATTVRCAAGPPPRCVAGEVKGRTITFLPLDGDRLGAPLGPFPLQSPEYDWALSPAGDLIAFVAEDGGVRYLDRAGREVHRARAALDCQLQDLTFDRDGRALYVGCWTVTSYLARLDWDGTTTILEERPHAWMHTLRVSPDGRRIAYSEKRVDTDVWLVELP